MNRRRALTIGLFLLMSLPIAENVLDVLLFAQKSDTTINDFSREISRQFSSRSESQGTGFFVAFFVFLAALAGGLVYLDFHLRRRNRAGIDNPRYLFSELVRAHELTRVEKRFLTDFADECDLEDPLPLFVEPRYFIEALDDDRLSDSHATIEYLLKKLFDIEPKSSDFGSKSRSRTYTGATTIIRPTVVPDEV